MAETAPQRAYPPREVFNALRYVVKTGAPWRWLPNDLPPWPAVYQQTRRWLAAGVFEQAAHDLRRLLREAAGRAPEPTAAVLDGRTLQSTPESGARAGYDGHKRKKGSKTHAGFDTLGHLLALVVTPASEQERDQVRQLAAAVQDATGESVALAFVDQGDTGDQPAADAAAHGIELAVVKLPRPRGGSCSCRGGGWPTPPSYKTPETHGLTKQSRPPTICIRCWARFSLSCGQRGTARRIGGGTSSCARLWF